MQRAAVLLAALTLAGCLPDRTGDMAACKREAARFYANFRAVDPDDPSSRYIIGCMAAKGYNFAVTPADCSSEHPMPTQPACYTSDGWLGWIADQFRNH